MHCSKFESFPTRFTLQNFLSFHSNSFDCRMAVAILSLPTGIDFSDYFPQYKSSDSNGMSKSQSMNFCLDKSVDDLSLKPIQKMMHIDSNLNLEGMTSSNSNSITIPQQGNQSQHLKLKDLYENSFSSSNAELAETSPANLIQRNQLCNARRNLDRQRCSRFDELLPRKAAEGNDRCLVDLRRRRFDDAAALHHLDTLGLV